MRDLVKKIFCSTLFTLVSANLYAETYYIDVRKAEEYAGDHIDNAINIEHSKIIEGINENNINKDDTIYVYCRSGKRAEFAKQMLEKAGFTKVTNLGGIEQAKTFIEKNK